MAGLERDPVGGRQGSSLQEHARRRTPSGVSLLMTAVQEVTERGRAGQPVTLELALGHQRLLISDLGMCLLLPSPC